MEVWLLGAGALVLVAITLWIVWPTPTNHTEVSKSMTENHTSTMGPQGDRFEDQYTSATADLSAGGVAASLAAPEPEFAANPAPAPTPHSVPTQEPLHSASGQRWPEASLEGERIGQASRSDTFPYGLPAADARSSLTQPKTIGLGAAALLAVAAAVAGAWLYARWQRERNKPINRLRRFSW